MTKKASIPDNHVLEQAFNIGDAQKFPYEVRSQIKKSIAQSGLKFK